MSMPRVTLLLALFLIVLGIVAYLVTGRESVTALIPTFLGIPLLACGLWGRREGSLKMAMHVAATLALLGFGGTVGGLVKTVRRMLGATLERPEAALVQAIVALACLVFLILAIRSFIQARRAGPADTPA